MALPTYNTPPPALIKYFSYRHFQIKRKFENILLMPFILIGRMIAFIKPLHKEYENFFFFPFYHTGGAEKVHALITQAVGGTDSIVFFTRKSSDQNFYNDFLATGCTIKDISKLTDNKKFYFLNLILRGIISGYINRQKKKALVFNGQCNFGYKLSPWVNANIPQIELIHSFNSFSWIRIPFIAFIAKTIMISKVRVEEHLQQYKNLHIPLHYFSRIQHIVNGIPLPKNVSEKSISERLQILYAGRGTEEKRVHIIAKMAKEVLLKNLPVDFIFMGDVQSAIPEDLLPYCKLIGHVSNPDEIESVYKKAHVVIITSYTEGFPLVIEEGMAHGCVVMATPVGDIPLHVRNNENGLLFTSVQNEDTIVTEGIEFLTLLCKDRNSIQKIGEKNKKYAADNFSIKAFRQSYIDIFIQLRNTQSETN